MKDGEGQPILPVDSKSCAVLDLNVDASNDLIVKEELDKLYTKHNEYNKELATVYETIDEPRKIIEELDIEISTLVKQNRGPKVATTARNEAHQDIVDVEENVEEPQLEVDVVSQWNKIDSTTVEHFNSGGQCCGYNCSFDSGVYVLDGNSLPTDSNSSSSLLSHWLPSSYTDNRCNFNSLSSFPSLRSHYVRLPKPGETFTTLQHLAKEFRELLRAQWAGRQDCRQS